MRPGNLAPQDASGAGDLEHLAPRQCLKQRVRHPIHGLRRAPSDKPDPITVVEDLERALADLLLLIGALEDRRVLPLGPLKAVVLAQSAIAADRHAVRAVA